MSAVNTATGFTAGGDVRDGRFHIHGLAIGGPHSVVVERLGYRTQQHDGVHLRLGDPVELHFVLEPAAIPLDAVRAHAVPFMRANAHGGTATTVPDSLLHRLPTLNRNLYDFVPLAPQLSTRIGFAPGGMSAGGVGFRFNSFLINGVSQRSIGGGVPPEFAGGRSIPFDAVGEYQLLIAPFDVRYGDFAGALVNAVTKSGTNELRATVFGSGRTGALARSAFGDSLRSFERLHYGLSVGGPIVRDRAHFFVTAELQHLTSLAPGPYVGQGAGSAVPVAEADLARFDEIMRAHGLRAGSGGRIENRNPLGSVFGRADVALPGLHSRAVVWLNATRSTSVNFSRPATDLFPLSTAVGTQSTNVSNASLQLHTTLRSGRAHNELLVSWRSADTNLRAGPTQPVVRVTVPNPSAGAVTVISGSPVSGSAAGMRAVSVRDDVTLLLGASHALTLGVDAEWFDVERSGVNNRVGTWTFSSLDSLEHGIAESYQIARDLGGGDVPLGGAHYAVYAGDRWQAGQRLSLTFGVRADLLDIGDRAPLNRAVDSIFGRRTSDMPRRRVHLSPRVGFTWDPAGTARTQLRGGAGIFTGRPPVAWLHAARYAYGSGIGTLRCGAFPTDFGAAPSFIADHRAAPESCANGVGLATAGDVDLLDRNLRMAQTLRTVIALDRKLANNLTGTVEAIATRGISDFVFVNLNLQGPRGTDRNGRVLYGTIGPTGLAAPAVRSAFTEVIDLRNTARNHSYQLSARLEKQVSAAAGATAHYTFTRARDVQTPLRIYNPAIVNWSSRPVSGRHDDVRAGISLNDVPHRVVVAGTQRAPWRRWTTELSFYYIGESGSPFTYLVSGAGRRGDLNADGAKNDPVYVPRSADDPAEIVFSGVSGESGADNSDVAQAARVLAQQDAFARFIARTPCLHRQRGRILERNSCRDPWSHTSIASVRQAVPIGARALEVQLDVYNVLNALNRGWGRVRTADPSLLEHVGHMAGSPETAQPVFRFHETTSRWITLPVESTAQLQVGLRYRF